jgi:hypothetical protein
MSCGDIRFDLTRDSEGRERGGRRYLILNSSRSGSILQSGQGLLDIQLGRRDTSHHQSSTVTTCGGEVCVGGGGGEGGGTEGVLQEASQLGFTIRNMSWGGNGTRLGRLSEKGGEGRKEWHLLKSLLVR